jgi:anti-sigma regulatory factor (Ser/Thr protein kinase)
MANDREGAELLDSLLDRLHEFTGPGWEQEDDITLVTVRRAVGEWHTVELEAGGSDGVASPLASGDVVAFEIPGAIGGERAAMDRVAEAVAPFGLPPARLEQLRTAVSETVMNAIEYGSQGRSEIPVSIAVSVTDDDVIVRVLDRALSGPVPTVEPPDLEAKLEGRQRPRGWGLFLIRHMVDAIDVAETDNGQIVTLTVARHDETGGIGR